MSKIAQFLGEVDSVSGAKKTKEVLAKYVGDVDVYQFLHVALDPGYSWYQSEIDPSAAERHPYTADQEDINWFISELLAKYNQPGGMVRGAEGAAFLAELYHQVQPSEKHLCERIIERTLKAGCGAKTIKQVFGESCVDVLPYMRCELVKHADGKKKATYDHFDWAAGVHSELKADGMFFNGLNDATAVTLRSRQGTFIKQVHQIEKVAREVNALANIIAEQFGIEKPVIHGEMLITASEDGIILYAGTKDEIEFEPGELLPREVSNGLINGLIKTGDPLPAGAIVHAQVWDVIPEKEWRAGKCDLKRSLRRKMLNFALSTGAFPFEVIELIPMRLVYSFEEAALHFAEMTAQGLEGTVIKNPDGTFKDGNSKDQLKVKVIVEFDLRIVGFNEADQKGKYADLFGSLQLASECGQLQVGCSGMSVNMRNELFAAKDRLVEGEGRIITVQCNGIMPKTKHNELFSLFLPRLAKDDDGNEFSVRIIEERLDKTKADTLEEMQEIYKAAIGLV